MSPILAIVLTLGAIWWAAFSTLPFMIRVAIVILIASSYRLVWG